MSELRNLMIKRLSAELSTGLTKSLQQSMAMQRSLLTPMEGSEVVAIALTEFALTSLTISIGLLGLPRDEQADAYDRLLEVLVAGLRESRDQSLTEQAEFLDPMMELLQKLRAFRK